MRSLGAVEQARGRVPAGQNLVTVAGEAAWPLTWYLRDVPTAWASRIEQATTPVIIADWDAEGALEKQLADKYDAKRVPIRASWFPEPRTEGGRNRPTFRDLVRTNFRGGLKPPFNDLARAAAGLTPSFYRSLSSVSSA